jgi:VHS domain
VVLELCEHASANETAAKEAARALRREFKYADPSAQLSAARLWAIMLQNCSEEFIEQSASRKNLDAVEDVITSNRTNPVVRERLLEVLGSAVYHHTKNDRRHSFAVLWRKVKPPSAPEQVRCRFLLH